MYRFHEGFLFTPGTGNWVFENPLDTPLQTIWGNGTMVIEYNYFNPFQPPPQQGLQTVVRNGIGGQLAGQVAFQPLLEPTAD